MLVDVQQHILLTQEGPNVPFSLMTNFPKKVFSSDDMKKTLKELGRTLPLTVSTCSNPCSNALSTSPLCRPSAIGCSYSNKTMIIYA